MTEYYTNKSDFEKGERLSFGENNVWQVVNLLKDISETAKIVKENDLSHLYIAYGGATLGKDMPEDTFLDSEHTIIDVMKEMKRVHREVVQNIENKYILGLEDAMEALNKVNEGKNKYKSEHFTYQETYTYQTPYQTGYGSQTMTGKRKAYYSISDIINSDKSPVPSALEKYQDKLKIAQENLKKLEKEDKETYDKMKDLSERELVEAFFPTELGEYKRLKSTWSKENEGWLGWVETGVKIVGTAALIVGTVASGGTLAPAALTLGTALLGGEAAYRAVSGETISGDVLSNEQRWWAAAEAVTTLASGGFATYLKHADIAGKTLSQTLVNAEKVARYSANTYDVAEFGRNFIEDPRMALFQLGTSQLIGRSVGQIGKYYKTFRANRAANVDISTGQASHYKGGIKERLSTAWSDVKTTVGNVRVRAGQSWDNFKTKVKTTVDDVRFNAGNVKNSLDVKVEEFQSRFSDRVEGLREKGSHISEELKSLRSDVSEIASQSQAVLNPSNGGAATLSQGGLPNFREIFDRVRQVNFSRHTSQAEFEGLGGGSGRKPLAGKEEFKSWKEVKAAHRGELTSQIHAKKPKGSPALKKWFDKGGSIEIETLTDGKQIWRYTSPDGVTVPYVQKTLENGLEVHVVDFSEHLHPDSEINTAKLESFTGNRKKDTELFLKEAGIDEIPKGYVVHHSEPNGTLQLVKKDIHEIFKHYGGHSWYK